MNTTKMMEALGFEPFSFGPGVHAWLRKEEKGDTVVDALDETLDGMDLSQGARIGYYLHTGNGWGDEPLLYAETQDPNEICEILNRNQA
jgi:hypothetical protein